jgi:formylmethanofuran dehydrogenase subunit E
MTYPDFFDDIERIEMKDPLSDLLGTFVNGEVTFSYLDVVKAAGHSCPTVAGAYLMTLKALKALYPGEKALRGNIKVAFSESQDEGVAGVIGNVVSHITGAAGISGFKGLNGSFARHSLMDFGKAVPSSARFTRVDSGACVDLYYNPNVVPPKPEMQVLMPKVMAGSAGEDELRIFGELWQERVERILTENSDNAQMVRVEGCQ